MDKHRREHLVQDVEDERGDSGDGQLATEAPAAAPSLETQQPPCAWPEPDATLAWVISGGWSGDIRAGILPLTQNPSAPAPGLVPMANPDAPVRKQYGLQRFRSTRKMHFEADIGPSWRVVLTTPVITSHTYVEYVQWERDRPKQNKRYSVEEKVRTLCHSGV